jgi:putative membrane protein
LSRVIVVAAVLAGLAALVHVYIFVLESLRWTDPATRKVFGTSAEDAERTRSLAYNQGFYNLFLALGALAGIVALGPDRGVGVALVVLSTGSMVAAALVLVTSDRSKARAAAVQGVLPALGLVALLAAQLG